MSRLSRLREVKAELEAEKAAILARTRPLRDERDALVAQIQPVLEKVRALEREYRAVEGVRVAEIDTEIGAIARALGGVQMGLGRG